MLHCKYLIRLIYLIFLHFVHGQEQCFEDGRYYTMAGGVTWNNTIEYGPNLCQKRCQNEAKCSYWVYHKPTITCSLQAGKDTSYYETDYISGPKYCDCYEDDTVYLDSPTIVIKETMADCKMECQKLSPLLIVWSYEQSTKRCFLYWHYAIKRTGATGFTSGPKCCKEEYSSTSKYCKSNHSSTTSSTTTNTVTTTTITTTPMPTTRSHKECECGRLINKTQSAQSRIWNGNEVPEHRYPWMMYLRLIVVRQPFDLV